MLGGMVVFGIVRLRARRRLRCSPYGHVNDEGLVDVLAAGEVGVECAAHVLLGAQGAVLSSLAIARDDAERDVGGIEAPAEGIGVLFENHVAHVVDQVVLADLDQRGRGILALDPDLAVQHGGAEVGGRGAKVVNGNGRAGRGGRLGSVGVRAKQRVDHGCIGGGNDRLAADEVCWGRGLGRQGGDGRDVAVCPGGGGQRGRGQGEGAAWGGRGCGRGRRGMEGDDGRGLFQRQLRTGGGGVVVARGDGAGGRVGRRARVSARGQAPRLAGRAQHLRPHHARVAGHVQVHVHVQVVVVRVCTLALGQLGQRHALADGAGRLGPPFTARRRSGRRRGRAASAQQLGASTLQPRLDAAHDDPHSPSMHACEAGERRREPRESLDLRDECLLRAARAIGGVARRCQRLPSVDPDAAVQRSSARCS